MWKDRITQFIEPYKIWFQRQSKLKKLLIKILSGTFGVFFLLYLLLIWDVFGPVPSRSRLKKIENHQTSFLYAADGTILAKYYVENRTNVDFDDLPDHLVSALVVTEDERFWEHSGIDWRAMFRVLFKTILRQDKSAGGPTTISQQLAKNLFGRKKGGKGSLIFDKLREIIIARRLEDIYTKEEIIAFYLNTVPFGNNAFGIQTASRTYFNRFPSQLSVEESATLVGMLKATTTYNPLQNKDKAKSRRDLVLQLMHQKGILHQNVLDSLVQLPLQVRPVHEENRYSPAPHFKSSVLLEVQQLLDSIPKANGEKWDVLEDGLRIYTSLDSKMQQYAMEAVEKQQEKLQKAFYADWGNQKPWIQDTLFILDCIKATSRFQNSKNPPDDKDSILQWFSIPTQTTITRKNEKIDTLLSPLDSLLQSLETVECAFLAIDKQGFVKAWVGGADFSRNQFDHVKAKRHIGSTMKPFVYAAALQNGLDPCCPQLNERKRYPQFEDYSPKNVDARYGGEFSFAGALNKSINVIAVDVGIQTGLEKVIGLANKAGLKGPIPLEPGLCLGAFDASLRELLEAYTIFQQRGDRNSVSLVTHVTDRFGNIILDFRNKKPIAKAVIDTTTADIMLQLLKGVVERGTGANAKWTYAPYWDLGGKTGTSQNYADGWFVGFSPDLIAGAWVGTSTQKIHFRSSTYGQSNYTALPIWGEVFKRMDKDPDQKYLGFRNQKFPRPTSLIISLLDCPTGDYPVQDTLEGEFLEDEWLDSLMENPDRIEAEPLENTEGR
jgi:penicillin-binding protein 1A